MHSRKEFNIIVEEGMKSIPDKFLKLLDNVDIVVEDEPNPAQKRKLNLRRGWTLFGLYEGIPQSKRGVNYGAVLPDKITIFQKPIEAFAKNEKEMKEMVKNTVWHEIAHHFGMNEERVRLAENKRRNIK
jgi:predicted Zn-dependent protease with MMP-like domain